MRTLTKITCLLFTVIMLNANAQIYGPKPGSPGFNNPNYNPKNYANANGNWNNGNKGYYKGYNKGYKKGYYKGYKGGWYGPKKYYGGGFNVIIGGGYPYGGWYSPGYGYGNYYGNYYYNQWGYSVKRSARYSLQMAGSIINDAVAFNDWNDTYSPILAKAIRHYNYARKLYYWGNYNAALNHAERARYLASYSFQYFQGGGFDDGFGYNYNNGGYGQGGQNPYGDPYDPYYNQVNPNSGNGNGGMDEDIYDDVQYKQQGNGVGNAIPNNGNPGNSNAQALKQALPKDDAIDKQLPGSPEDDKLLIKSFKPNDVKDE